MFKNRGHSGKSKSDADVSPFTLSIANFICRLLI